MRRRGGLLGRLGLGVALLGLAGCASAPPRRGPDLDLPLPEAWGGTPAPGAVAGEWWVTFNDARLTALVRTALARNQDLRAAAARIDAAAAQARIAGADRWPQGSVGLDRTRQRRNFIGFPGPGGGGPVQSTTATNLGVTLQTTWEMDLWGRLRAGKAAALADWQAAEAEYAWARVSLAAQTTKAWFAAVEAGQQVALAEETVGSYQASTQSVRSRYARGLRPSLDLRLAESDSASAAALLAQRRDALDRAVRQLEILLGGYPTGTLTPAVALPGLPGPVPAGLPAELVTRRPDLAAAERRWAAADARTRQARRALFPRFSLTGSGGTASEELEDLLDGDFRVWALATGLLQPIFQGGKLRAGVRQAQARTAEAQARFAGAALAAFREVETALAAEVHLARREEALARAATQAGAARRLAEDRYRAGLEDVITLLDAQRRALTAESSLLEVRRQRLANRVDLHLALGGGFAGGAGPGEAAS